MRNLFEHRQPRTTWSLLLVLLTLWGSPATSQVFRLESLIMPDRLAEPHAHLENDCTTCHASNDEQSQNSLCVGCHISVGSDVESGQGFHGRHPDAGQNECSSCHTDHEGRDADIVGFDETTFDHSWTDMMLRSAHVMLFCSDCHSLGAAMNAAPNTCVGCHVQDDVHQLQMGATCNDCHNETSWQDARFDHSTTDFLLVGRHQDATCTACHTDHVYNGVPTDCASCHVQDDVHNGRNGSQCGSCHSSSDWEPEFDHVAVSQFPLLGAHEMLTCDSCHTQNLSAPLPTSCHGCHQSEDVHMGGLGTDCGSCVGQIRELINSSGTAARAHDDAVPNVRG